MPMKQINRQNLDNEMIFVVIVVVVLVIVVVGVRTT